MNVPFFWVDVFAATPLAGNPLSLVPDADALPTETMQAIAREFNQSETTFLVRPTIAGADHRLRSFTPGGFEVLGAGHNAMGAWLWLALSGRLDEGRGRYVQQIGDELLPVGVARDDAGGAVVTMQQSEPRFLARVGAETRAALAHALGLGVGDLSDERSAEVVSTGAEHLLVPVRGREAVDAAQPDTATLRALLAEIGAEGCYVYTTDADPTSGIAAYARFFNPTVGIAEDPATGTAAGPLAALLVRDGLASEGTSITVEQGTALGRPSRIGLRVDGPVVTISGSGIIVAEGVLRL
jgi:PhzF family phenazine biosynthesis protein